jgi:2-hydroxychromene-2-carboxylate isomerase
MSNTISWYFDFISPFAYLQQVRFREFPNEITIQARPVLFAALLNHWQHKGPAEIPTKRIFTYQHVVWLAKRLGVPLRMPPAHPFNPLRPLRLAIAMENDLHVIADIFKYIWHDGLSVDDDASWFEFVSSLGIDEPDEFINQAAVKQQLRINSEAAIEAGVFGVPTIIADGHLFWGNDATDMYLDYQQNPDFFADPELSSINDIPEAASRKK